MSEHTINRRDWLAAAGLGGLGLARPASATTREPRPSPFRFGLNTSTISGQGLPIAQVVDLAARAGYQAIEPWTKELDAHVAGGKTLDDLGRRLKGGGLAVESVIGFFEWAVDDDARRQKALEDARRDFAKVKAIGGTRIAAPPFGATERADLDLRRVADRYRELCRVGREFGVVPEIEVWGFSKSITTLGEAVQVAVGSGVPEACVLADVYHLYKGGSDAAGLNLVAPRMLKVMHMNDYPAIDRPKIADSDRVFPGDGVAPLGSILRGLRDAGAEVVLSLEVFNRAYWKRDAGAVLAEGLAKMKASVAKALAT